MEKSRLPSTIVIGVFILLLLLPVIALIQFNLAQAMQELSDQASQSAQGQKGSAAGVIIVAGFGSLGLILYAVGLIVITFIPCFILIFFSARNIKVQVKPIRIFNIVFTSILGAIMLLDVIKLILFVTGVA